MPTRDPIANAGGLPHKKRRLGGHPSRWFLAFLANLPIPTLFIIGRSEGPARFGLALGLIGLVLAGWIFYLAAPRFTNCFALAATFVAISQAFPVMHFIVGAVAIELASPDYPYLFDEEGYPAVTLTTFPKGLVATLTIGTLFSGLTILLGLFLRYVWPGYDRREQQPRALSR